MTENNNVSLVVFIETKANCANQQIDAFRRLQPLVLAEKGCLQYELTRVAGEENQFILLEKFASQVDLDAHDNAPYMKEADKQNPSFRTKPATVYRVEKI